MARPSKLLVAQEAILSSFENIAQRAFSKAQLLQMFRQNRDSWRLAKHTTPSDFISFLEKQGHIRAHKFRSEEYGREIIRFSRGNPSYLELAQTLKTGAYLCHGSAVSLHNLAPQNPRTIFVNAEQSSKPPFAGTITQEGIDRAFQREQRVSNLIYVSGNVSVTVISGKNTKRLGVENVTGSHSEPLSVTDLERTLIDIVVRPRYAGGIQQVVAAYRAAKDRASADRLFSILKELDYTYPYHQSIGFLLEHTGYPLASLSIFQQVEKQFDFYLVHAMKDPEYCPAWRLFYPKTLVSTK